MNEIQFSGLVLEYCKPIRCLPKQLLFPLNKLNYGCVGGAGGGEEIVCRKEKRKKEPHLP